MPRAASETIYSLGLKGESGESVSSVAIKEKIRQMIAEFAEKIRQANEDVEKIQVTGGKISQQFQRIEAAELEDRPAANVVRLPEERDRA